MLVNPKMGDTANNNHSSSPSPSTPSAPPASHEDSPVKVAPLKMPPPGQNLPTAPGTPGTPGNLPGPNPVPQTPTGAPLAPPPLGAPGHPASAFETDLPQELLQQGKAASI